MERKRKEVGKVISQKELAPGIFDMWIETHLAQQAAPGQFVMIYPRAESTILPRPISICQVEKEAGRLRIVYRVAGKGTGEFAGYRAGEDIALMGTLGNGFPLKEAEGKRALLLGGGIGIPPLLQLARELPGEKTVLAGYRDNHMFLQEDLEQCGPFYAATEDGSVGIRGNVMDALMAHGLEGDVIYACGPMPMLRAVKHYAGERDIPAYLSLEERMACGVGACLGCVCKTTRKDAHSHVNNARICTEGPVFEASEVDIG